MRTDCKQNEFVAILYFLNNMLVMLNYVSKLLCKEQLNPNVIIHECQICLQIEIST